MSRSRARFLAVQVAVVAVLLLIVYMTWLRSDDDGSPLFGVNVPSRGDQIAQAPGAPGEAGDRGEQPRRGAAGGGGETRGQRAGRGESRRSGGGASASGAATVTPPATARPLDEADSPTAEQYSDTVARLIERAAP